jgi:hypothetical protein
LFTSALSGWSYAHWQGVLYPHQLPPRKELDRYIQHYQKTLPSRFWLQHLPQGFLMTVKVPRPVV